MLDKKACMLCFQKHEEKWEDEDWKEGFISCPMDAMPKVKTCRGKNLDSNCGEVKLLKAIYGLRETIEKAPCWCEFNSL